MLYKFKPQIDFPHTDLVVAVAARSKLVRVKVRQALKEQVEFLFETDEMTALIDCVGEMKPRVLILDFRFFNQDDFPGSLLTVAGRPRIILIGTQDELERDQDAKGVDALLCHPFLADMLRLKINAVLDPDRCWKDENARVLTMMRKYQRFKVENVHLFFQKPVQERTHVLDMSFQGLKATSEKVTGAHVGEIFQIQIASEGAYILCHAKVQWVRDGHVGLCFTRPKPQSFSDFFLRVVARATDLDY